MPPEATEPEKVEELWFEDADIIFQAGQKQFKVHRSILSARSSVFRDMFSVPQPESPVSPGDKTSDADNCMVIYLPDSEKDICNFFSAIFDSSFFESPPSLEPLETIISILRLSHKYDVGFLKRRAISHLNLIFTTDMETFFNSREYAGRLRLTDALKVSFLDLIEVACRVPVQWIIPAAFFWASQVTISKILTSKQWRNLNPALQRHYLIFRERYIQDRERLGRWMLEIPGEECSTPARCLKSSRWYMKQGLFLISITETRALWGSSSGPLRELGNKFCNQCAYDAIKLSGESARRCWNDYPTILGLPGWEALKDEKSDFAKSH